MNETLKKFITSRYQERNVKCQAVIRHRSCSYYFFFLLRNCFEIGWFEGGGWHLVARRGWLTEIWNFYLSRGSFMNFFCCKHFCFWIDFTALWSVLCFGFIPQLMASSKTCVPNGDILKPKVSRFLLIYCYLLISY